MSNKSVVVIEAGPADSSIRTSARLRQCHGGSVWRLQDEGKVATRKRRKSLNILYPLQFAWHPPLSFCLQLWEDHRGLLFLFEAMIFQVFEHPLTQDVGTAMLKNLDGIPSTCPSAIQEQVLNSAGGDELARLNNFVWQRFLSPSQAVTGSV